MGSPATPRSPPPPLSPPLALLPPPSPLSEVPTPVLDVTSPTPLEPSMLPRGRLRLTPTTMEDTTDVDTDSATGATDTVSDTAVDTTGVRFCQDVLDLVADILSLDWVERDFKLALSTKSGIVVSRLICEVFTTRLG